MQYVAHSIVFYAVAGWTVKEIWMRSRVAAAILATLIIAGEAWLALSEPLAGAVLRPLVAVCHVAVYVLLLAAVVWWSRRSGHARRST
jgi:hypothetical protein